MTRVEIERCIVISFEEYTKSVTLDQDFSIRITKSTKSMISNFINWVDEYHTIKGNKSGLNHVSYEFIVKYFDFQYSYWIWKYNEDPSRYSRYGFKSIQINWIIGKTGIKRFEKNSKKVEFLRSKREIRGTGDDLLKRFKEFDSSNLKAIKKTFLSGTNENEEFEKGLFYNTNEGLINCISETTLYNPKSKLCELCNIRMRCKEILKTNIPNLYKIRFNG